MQQRQLGAMLGMAFFVIVAAACEQGGGAAQAAAQPVARDSSPRLSFVPEVCARMRTPWTDAVTPVHLLAERAAADSVRAARERADSIRADSLRVVAADGDSVRAAAARAALARMAAAAARARPVAARDTYPTPPEPLPGAILPGCRIVAYYGNPMSNRMGIMGALPPDRMLARLDSQAKEFERADSATPVIRALELITPVAQSSPGPRNLWRTRMPDTLIARVSKLAEENDHLFFLDVQVGKSTVAAELEPLVQYLRQPHTHLALDPEFSMKGPEPPGKVIGTMDAADINVAIDLLAKLVDEHKLPPKVLVIHRFTRRMVTNEAKIRRDPRVQVVIDMDGFGPPRLKLASYKAYAQDRPVQYFGIKLFYKNDKPIFSARDVMRLNPIPQYIQYQ